MASKEKQQMKSIEIKFAEAMDAVKKAGRTKQFEEKTKGCTTIEAKLNAAEAVLKDVGVVRVKESATTMQEVVERLSHEQYQVFSKRRAANPNMSWQEQMKLAEDVLSGQITESAPIRRHNGSADRFVEGNPFGPSANEFSPGYLQETTNPHESGMKVTADGLLKCGKITEAEHAKLTGAKPQGYEALTEKQRKEFDFARLIGINEADSFRVARLSR